MYSYISVSLYLQPKDEPEKKQEEKPKEDETKAVVPAPAKPLSQNDIDFKLAEGDSKFTSGSYSSSSYSKTTEIKSFGSSSVTSSTVETSSSNPGDNAPNPQDIIDKIKQGAMSPDGMTQVSSSSRRVITTTTSMKSSSDEPPQIESVRTTTTSKSEIDAEGKETKESSSKTEVKTDGSFPVSFPERPTLSGLQTDKSDPVPAIEIESPSPVKPG